MNKTSGQIFINHFQVKNLTPAHGQGASGNLPDRTNLLGTTENTLAINHLSAQYVAVLFQDQVKTDLLNFIFKN